MVRAFLVLFFLVTFTKISVGDHDHSSHESHSHSFDHFHDHVHKHDYTHEHDHYTKSNPKQLWTDTISAVVGISVAPFILLFLVPDLNKHRDFLKILLGFAGGGLLGDAFLHLIPHALFHTHNYTPKDTHGHSHSLSNKNTHVFIYVISGIFVFLCIDKFLRILRFGHEHAHGLPAAEKNDKKQKSAKSGDGKNVSTSSNGFNKSKAKSMATAGYLNLAADFTHNFTDGVAIAGSFLIGRNVGYVTTLTVLIHELPHEIGDYAILIMSGCGVYRAMLLQLVTALGAVLGAGLSLFAAGVGIDGTEPIGSSALLSPEFVTTCLLPFTAGGFIYIALVSVLPDLLNDRQSSDNRNRVKVTRRIRQTATELIAVVVGVAMMAVIGLFE